MTVWDKFHRNRLSVKHTTQASKAIRLVVHLVLTVFLRHAYTQLLPIKQGSARRAPDAQH